MPSETAEPDKNELFRRLVAPHVDSFNYFCGAGLRKVVEILPRVRIDDGSGRPVSVWFDEVTVERPMREESRANALRKDLRIFPRECREAGTSYSGALSARVCWAAENEEENVKQLKLSSFPIMVRSGHRGDNCSGALAGAQTGGSPAHCFGWEVLQPPLSAGSARRCARTSATSTTQRRRSSSSTERSPGRSGGTSS